MSENTKTCSRCKTDKPMIAFSRACNSVLGYSKDNINTLSKAIEYLEKFYE